MSQIEGSDIWFHSFEVPDTTRLSYRIAPNVPQLLKDANREQRKAVLATATPDPLNRQPTFGSDTGLFGAASTLTLKYASSDQVATEQKRPKGLVSHFSYSDSMSDEERKISIYQPNRVYPLDKASPLLILFDGDAT